MKTRLFIVLVLGLISFQAFSQTPNVLDGVYVKENTLTREPLPYPFLREADVMWKKRIWRVMDLQEKINLPFKYPSSKSTSDRRNLMDVFVDAIKEGRLTAYGFEDDEFLPVRPYLLLIEVCSHFLHAGIPMRIRTARP